jgi:hypothetical protein
MTLLAVALALSAHGGGRKPKEPPAPTQEDIIRGCVGVQQITYQGWKWLVRDAGTSAMILNDCDSVIEVSLTAALYDASGTQIDLEFLTKIVPPHNSVGVWMGSEDARVSVAARIGIIKRVSANFVR